MRAAGPRLGHVRGHGWAVGAKGVWAEVGKQSGPLTASPATLGALGC